MEEMLDPYAAHYDDDEVLACMDEASKQLLRDERPPIPAAPGRPLREDYHYDRRGVQAIFMQCLDRRIGDVEESRRELAAWQDERNAGGSRLGR